MSMLYRVMLSLRGPKLLSINSLGPLATESSCIYRLNDKYFISHKHKNLSLYVFYAG